jgi:hypothetical protein
MDMIVQSIAACTQGTPIAAVLVKPPEAFLIFTTGHDDYYFFDSHGHKVPGVNGACTVCFRGEKSALRLSQFLDQTFPYVELPDADALQRTIYNRVEVNVFEAGPAPSSAASVATLAAMPPMPPPARATSLADEVDALKETVGVMRESLRLIGQTVFQQQERIAALEEANAQLQSSFRQLCSAPVVSAAPQMPSPPRQAENVPTDARDDDLVDWEKVPTTE